MSGSPVDDEGAEGQATVVALLSLLLLLGAVLCIGRLLERFKILWMSEAGVALLLGLLVGGLVRAGGAEDAFKEKLSFNPHLFLYVLLPTIMFDAGYTLDPKPFVRNIGSISAYAFIGTAVGTFIIGYLMYGFGVAGWCTQPGAIYNLIFGAIISATDPVTVLAIFSQLEADKDLYINVFGESSLNDAVAMVLYETLEQFVHEQVTVGSVFRGIGIFFGIFLGSVVFGLIVGVLAALLFKSRWLRDEHNSMLETGMFVIIAFLSYMTPQAAHLSGIVSVLFCAIFMRLYVRPNLSVITQLRVEALFKTLSGLFELFLFVYIGLYLFLLNNTTKYFVYTGFVLIGLAVSRAANIFPLSAMVNFFRLPEKRIPGKQQFMMWWSGLRGAMAFALAIDAANKFGEAGDLIQSTTFYIIFVTVLINGGASAFFLDRLNLREQTLPHLETAEKTDKVTDKGCASGGSGSGMPGVSNGGDGVGNGGGVSGGGQDVGSSKGGDVTAKVVPAGLFHGAPVSKGTLQRVATHMRGPPGDKPNLHGLHGGGGSQRRPGEGEEGVVARPARANTISGGGQGVDRQSSLRSHSDQGVTSRGLQRVREYMSVGFDESMTRLKHRLNRWFIHEDIYQVEIGERPASHGGKVETDEKVEIEMTASELAGFDVEVLGKTSSQPT